jgi:D-alanyl-D-alanine carboxypeptidase
VSDTVRRSPLDPKFVDARLGEPASTPEYAAAVRGIGVKAVALIALATTASLAIILGGIALRSGSARPSADNVVAAGSPGALVLVDNGSSRREKTSGFAVLKGRVPLDVHDRFRVGSITKTFVAVVVLQLVSGTD